MLAKQQRRDRAQRRQGLTLLEVLVSLAIFLFAFAVLSQLIGMGGNLAVEAQNRSEAAQKARRKLAEVVSGVQPLSSTSGTEDDWEWSVDCEQGSVANLWN